MTISTVPIEPTIPIDDGSESFDSFAATLPETAQGFLDAAFPQVTTESVQDAGIFGSDVDLNEGDATPRPRKRVDISKKMKRSMTKFRQKVGNVPAIWFHNQAKDNPEWELDDEEKELLQDSIDTVFEVLDVGFEIEPISWTLTSIWWVVSYPVLMFGFLFLTKKSRIIEKEQKDGEVPQP